MTGKSHLIESHQQDIFPELHKSSSILHKNSAKKHPRKPALSTQERSIIADHMRDIASELPPTSWEMKNCMRLRDEADRYSQCGVQFEISICENDQNTFREPRSCNSRICEHCAGRYARNLAPSIETLFKPLLSKKVKGYGLFMLTLTTTTKRFTADGPGRADIMRFYQESAKFLKLYYGRYAAKMTKTGKVIEDQTRMVTSIGPKGKIKTRRKPKIVKKRDGTTREEWRRFRGAGHMSSMELGAKSNMLHLHAIVYGPFVPITKLRQSWAAITGDSWNVDIRPVKNPKKAVWYVLKYIVKPPRVDSYRTMAEYAYRIKGSRRIRTGGIFYNRIERQVIEKLDRVCPYCGGPLSRIGVEVITDPDNHSSQPLYKLLREVRERGSPLPLPDHSLTAEQRFALGVLADAIENDPWMYGMSSS